MWAVDYAEIEAWLDTQDDETVAHVFAALEVLQEQGPSLGRPLVDIVKGSRFKNLKELRPASTGRSEVRILFVFDPGRQAVMLVAGDKGAGKRARDTWTGWYRKAVPEAERVYERYLAARTDGHGRPE